MREPPIHTFLAGGITSVLLLSLLLYLTGASPRQVEKKYQQKALEMGYATNVIVLDKNGDYGLEFRWITNTQHELR